jgi:hypothetical protein
LKFRPFGKYYETVNAAKLFSSFIIYPEPVLPQKIDEEINRSCRLCWENEKKERYDLYGYNDRKVYIFSTESLEEKGVVTGRDVNNVYCGSSPSEANEKIRNILNGLKSKGLTTIEHHVHVDDSMPSLIDILRPRELEYLDMSIISRPRAGRIFLDINKLRKIAEDEIIKSYKTILNNYIKSRTIFPFFSLKIRK